MLRDRFFLALVVIKLEFTQRSWVVVCGIISDAAKKTEDQRATPRSDRYREWAIDKQGFVSVKIADASLRMTRYENSMP